MHSSIIENGTKQAILPTTTIYGKTAVTTAGTRVALKATATALKNGLTVKALDTNTGKIYIGDSSVSSSNGYQLASGEQVFVSIDDANKVYIDSAVNGEAVSFIGG